MNRLLIPILLLAAACSGSSELDGQEAASTAKKPNSKVVALVDDANCTAGNGTHETAFYDVASFEARDAFDDMSLRDERLFCSSRIRSNSKESGARAFHAFLDAEVDFDAHLFDSVCDHVKDRSKLRAELMVLADDPTNVAVFSGTPDESGKGACRYFTFDVYRRDGTAVRFDFDYAD